MMLVFTNVIHLIGIVMASIVISVRLRLAWESLYEIRKGAETGLTFPMLLVNARDAIMAGYVIVYYIINFNGDVRWYGFPLLLIWLTLSIWGVILMRDSLMSRRAHLFHKTDTKGKFHG